LARKFFIVEVILILLLVQGCANRPESITATPSPTVTRQPAPAPTLTRLPPTSSPTPQINPTSILIPGQGAPVDHLAWSPDGSLLATSSGNFQASYGVVRLWHADGSLAYELKGHTGSVAGLAWSPDGKILASASLDKTIRLWSAQGKLLKILHPNTGQVFAVAWSPDGKTLASGSLAGFLNPIVQLWDRQGWTLQHTLKTSFSGGKFYNLAWSPDGKYLVGGATDYKLWRADGSLVYWLQGCAACTPAWGMAWSPDSRFWAVGDEGGDIQIFTNAGVKIATAYDLGDVNSLAWSPDGRLLAGSKTLWHADGTVLNYFRDQAKNVFSAAWSPDGKLLATGGDDKIVHLWGPDGKPLGVLKGHSGNVNVVAWSPDGKILASGSDDATIRLWKIH
jgi:WD40 repeat protein